jgi:hypothetical protein
MSDTSIWSTDTTYRLVVIPSDSLNIVLDHPLQDLLVLVSFSNQVSDVNERVFRLIIGYRGHESPKISIAPLRAI